LVFKLNAKELIDGKDQLEKQKRHEKTLRGAEEEEKIFKEMQNSMKSLGIKNTVVINGWKDNGINNTVKREYDFLIICEPLRAIFNIESKTAFNSNNFRNPAKQLKSGLEFFQDKLPFPESEKWSYVRVASFANMSSEKMLKSKTTEIIPTVTAEKPNVGEEVLNLTEEISNLTSKMSTLALNVLDLCSKCEQFVVGPNWSFSIWWKKIEAQLPSQTNPERTETYSDIIKFLLHQMLMQKGCLTGGDITNYSQEKIERISTLENIFFWNNVQFSLLVDCAKKRVVFASSFGTGKTSCIKAKVEQLLQETQKVVIVVFQDGDTSKDSLLKKTYEIHFQGIADQHKEGITIKSIRGTGFIIFSTNTNQKSKEIC
jgi:hypothetical protein